MQIVYVTRPEDLPCVRIDGRLIPLTRAALERIAVRNSFEEFVRDDGGERHRQPLPKYTT